jgi:hypothetical protein
MFKQLLRTSRTSRSAITRRLSCAASHNQRIASTKLRGELETLKRVHSELARACAEAKNALELANEINKAATQTEAAHRRRLLNRNNRKIKAQTTKYLALEDNLRNQQTFLYCSELLDFLRSGRRALTPSNLARALAGLPDMRWRQSDVRCSKIPEDAGMQHPYIVFQLIDRVASRIRERKGELSIHSFEMELKKCPKKERYPRDFLCDHRRDLRLAIEEVCKRQYERGFIPYALTTAFLNNVSRLKTSVDTVLDSQERLTL